MSTYNAAIVFFISREDTKEKDELLESLSKIKDVDVLDVYDDGEDWNVECDVMVECNQKGRTKFRPIDKALEEKLPIVTWDYHYIKGVDNGFYWCP